MKFRIFNTPVPLIPRGRKYPIQRDEEGLSLRKRCFNLFKQGRKPKEVAKKLEMKLATAYRYFSEWNRCPPIHEVTYNSLRNELKKKGELSPRIIGILKEALGMPEWEIVAILSQSNGLKSLLKGKYAKMRKRELYGKQEQRLESALHLVVDLERIGVPIEFIHREIKQLIQRAVKYANAHKGDDQGEATENDIQIP